MEVASGMIYPWYGDAEKSLLTESKMALKWEGEWIWVPLGGDPGAEKMIKQKKKGRVM